jgi:hypothetical protein
MATSSAPVAAHDEDPTGDPTDNAQAIDPITGIDLSLFDDFAALSVRDRFLRNDASIRLILELQAGVATIADDDRR